MRRRLGLLILATTLVACAGITGLGDYSIDDGTPDAAGAETGPRADGPGPALEGGAADVAPRDATISDAPAPPPDCSSQPCDVVNAPNISDVAVDDQNLYWLDDKAKSVRVASLDGSNARDFVTGESSSSPLRGLEVTAGWVVWLSKSFRRVRTSGGTVQDNSIGALDNVTCVRKASGNDVVFLRNQDIYKFDVTTGSGGPFAPSGTMGGVGIAGSGSNGGATDFFITGNSRIYEVKQLGGNASEIIGNLTTPECIVLLASGALWWANNGDGQLYHSQADRKVWSGRSNQSGIHGVSANSTHVYWTYDSGIRRLKL